MKDETCLQFDPQSYFFFSLNKRERESRREIGIYIAKSFYDLIVGTEKMQVHFLSRMVYEGTINSQDFLFSTP